jgi:hypothetical protein
MKTLLLKIFATFALLTGVAFAQHGIELTWTQGTCTQSCTITKNTVYSAPTATGPFTPIYTSTAAITSYLVPLTTSNQGVQACFEVSAWTTIESPLSSPAVCQTFPVQGGAPSAVSATQQ